MSPDPRLQARQLAEIALSPDTAAALHTLRGALAGAFRGQPATADAWYLAALAVVAADALLPAQREALTAAAHATLAALGQDTPRLRAVEREA